VDERQTTRVKVPAPGAVTFTRSFEVIGGIFVNNIGRMEEIYQLNDRTLRETVMLQPGTYEVIYRSRLSRSMRSTNVQKITVKPGEAVTIKL